MPWWQGMEGEPLRREIERRAELPPGSLTGMVRLWIGRALTRPSDPLVRSVRSALGPETPTTDRDQLLAKLEAACDAADRLCDEIEQAKKGEP